MEKIDYRIKDKEIKEKILLLGNDYEEIEYLESVMYRELQCNYCNKLKIDARVDFVREICICDNCFKDLKE